MKTKTPKIEPTSQFLGQYSDAWKKKLKYAPYALACVLGAKKHPEAVAILEFTAWQHYEDKSNKVSNAAFFKKMECDLPKELQDPEFEFMIKHCIENNDVLDNVGFETDEEEELFEKFLEDASCWPNN